MCRKSQQEFSPLKVSEQCNMLIIGSEVDFVEFFLADARASAFCWHVDLLWISKLL